MHIYSHEGWNGSDVSPGSDFCRESCLMRRLPCQALGTTHKSPPHTSYFLCFHLTASISLHIYISLFSLSICLLHPGCLSPGNGANLFSRAKSVSPLARACPCQQRWWQITPTCLSALCTCGNRVCLREISVRVCAEKCLCFSFKMLRNRKGPRSLSLA